MTRLTLDGGGSIYFYEQDHYYLSNFSAFNLLWRGETFQTSEAAYQWEKFYDGGVLNSKSAQRAAVRHRILHAPSAHQAFKTAELNADKKLESWDDIKVGRMKIILREKTRQHEYVRRKLLETGGAKLVENSWRDDFWGWGPNRDGRNALGELWMEIREELRSWSPSPRSSGTILPGKSGRPEETSSSGTFRRQEVDRVQKDPGAGRGGSSPKRMCQSCEFFERKNEIGGSCRRYPSIVAQEFYKVGEVAQSQLINCLPYVENSEWCGEFKSC